VAVGASCKRGRGTVLQCGGSAICAHGKSKYKCKLEERDGSHIFKLVVLDSGGSWGPSRPRSVTRKRPRLPSIRRRAGGLTERGLAGAVV